MEKFLPSANGTIGAEIELWLFDRDYRLAPAVKSILEKHYNLPHVKDELWECQVELNSGICENVQELRADLDRKIKLLEASAHSLDLKVVPIGTCYNGYPDKKLLNGFNDRYAKFHKMDEQMLLNYMDCGLHVHIGIDSLKNAIRVSNGLMYYIPHLVALSASSPYKNFDDTQKLSSRSKSFNTDKLGVPYVINDDIHFQTFSEKHGGIKNVYWDIRIRPDFGTVEVRVCDMMPTLDDTICLSAVIQALVLMIIDGFEIPRLNRQQIIDNKNQAVLYGRYADIMVGNEIISLETDICDMLEQIIPTAEKLGSKEDVIKAYGILVFGNSAERQREMHRLGESREQIIDNIITEYKTNTYWRRHAL